MGPENEWLQGLAFKYNGGPMSFGTADSGVYGVGVLSVQAKWLGPY